MKLRLDLDPDVRDLIESEAARRGQSFDEVVNDAIRAGLGGGNRAARSFMRPRALGAPRFSSDKTLQLAAEIEDEAHQRRRASGGDEAR